MKHLSALTLAAGLGLALVSTAQAQNYAPSVDYQHPARQEGLLNGRSAYEHDLSATASGRSRAHRDADDHGAALDAR